MVDSQCYGIFQCLNRGFFFTSSLVSGEWFGRKILKKIPVVPSSKTTAGQFAATDTFFL